MAEGMVLAYSKEQRSLVTQIFCCAALSYIAMHSHIMYDLHCHVQRHLYTMFASANCSPNAQESGEARCTNFGEYRSLGSGFSWGMCFSAPLMTWLAECVLLQLVEELLDRGELELGWLQLSFGSTGWSIFD
jgi:hypothetical protein